MKNSFISTDIDLKCLLNRGIFMVVDLNGFDRVQSWKLNNMDVLVRWVLVFIFLQIKSQVQSLGVEHLTQADKKCFPYDFVYNLEERVFVRLLVVPYLRVESLRDLSRLEIVPEENPRYNEFLSCIWRDRGFQKEGGTIDFDAVQDALTAGIANEVGSTGPGLNLSKLEAERMMEQCNNLGGLTHGSRVIRVRNCILKRIKKFVEEMYAPKDTHRY